MSGHYLIRFIDAEAEKEYLKLDGSIKKLVAVGLKKLTTRADEIGKELGGELKGCKELKYRKNGIRVIFRIVNGEIEIVEIVAIGNRREDTVFAEATKRVTRQYS